MALIKWIDRKQEASRRGLTSRKDRYNNLNLKGVAKKKLISALERFKSSGAGRCLEG